MKKSRKQQKNQPKIVSIQLKKRQSPQKDKKKRFNSGKKQHINNDKFKLPLHKLKKTFQPDVNVFDQIRKHSEVIKQELKQKRESQQFEEQIEIQEFNIQKKELQIYYQRKGYIIEKDLQRIKIQQFKKIISIACWRQQKSQFFDFIYALWDSGKLDQVCKKINY